MSEPNRNSNIISVIDDYDYSTQNDVYNAHYKKWRQRSDVQYTFSYKANKLESVYVTGKGFIETSIVEAEKAIVSHIFNLFGIAALMFVVLDNTADKLIISIMKQFGMHINFNFFDSSITGGKQEILTVLLLCGAIKVLIPSIYMHAKLKMPFKVAFMGKLHDPFALIGAIGSALIVTTAVSIPIAYSGDSKEIYTYFTSVNANIAVWEQKELMIYTVFDVIIVPIFMELLYRGAIFGALRQFGDPFAIIMSALTSALLTQDFRIMPAAFLISLVAGYGMVTSGTIFTPICVHIVYKMYNLSITLIELNQDDTMPLMRNMFMMTALIIGSTGLAAYWTTVVHKQKNNLALYRSEFNTTKRMNLAVRTFPFSAIAVICLLRAIIRLILRSMA